MAIYIKGMNTSSLKYTVKIIKALADSTRVKLLALLTAKSLCVCELTCAVDLAQPTVSRHLNQLQDAGFVSRKRQGTWIIYSLAPADATCRGLLDIVMEQALNDPECQQLIKSLDNIDRHKISGSGKCRKQK